MKLYHVSRMLLIPVAICAVVLNSPDGLHAKGDKTSVKARNAKAKNAKNAKNTKANNKNAKSENQGKAKGKNKKKRGKVVSGKHLGLKRTRRGKSEKPRQMVGVELALLVDTSGSVDAGEYKLQQAGYVAAFRDADVVAAIESQGGIAASYIEWSGADHQDTRVGWTLLRTKADCRKFSNKIARLRRVAQGGTYMPPAIRQAAEEMERNDFLGRKRVIDIAGDGVCSNWYLEQNSPRSLRSKHGPTWGDVLPSAMATVDQINGICITGDPNVVKFYNDVLPQGDDAFSVQVKGFAGFRDAIKQKILKEVIEIRGNFD